MSQKVKLICCKTMKEEVERIRPDRMPVEYMEYALHRTPEKLRQELQQRIDEEKETDILVFIYGHCSRGLEGLKARDKTLVIPKVHDCISLLLGSREKYDQEFGQAPGTYYLSKGWVDQKADPLQEYENYAEKYGEENARWVTEEMYKNYKRVAFIDTNLPGAEEYEEYARKVADFLGVEFMRLQGVSDFFEKLIGEDWDRDCIVVFPGEESKSRDFM